MYNIEQHLNTEHYREKQFQAQKVIMQNVNAKIKKT